MTQPRDESAAAGADPEVRRFGDYELLEEIARGGMGAVHRARQISLDRVVALKLILGGPLAGRDQVERFRAEAQAAANLRHPHIVAIHEVGEHEGQLYFSMDYIEGKNLAQVIADLRFQISNFPRSAQWLRTIAEAVHYAHQHGILHRDLKPANIIIDQGDQPHITDFGLAKRLSHPQLSTLDAQLTLSGQVLGSPSYLSPEQAEGKRGAVGVASDVYSLGAVLYHLVTGRPPFQGESLTALLRQVVENDPIAPRLLNPSIPRDLETICLKCLEKEPARRYASAQELADELGRFLADEPIRARRAGAVERAWRWCRRNPKLAGALGAVVLSLALGLATTTWQMRRAQASELATRQRAYASDMDLASRALIDEDFGRVHELLNRYRPAVGSTTGASSLFATRHSPLAADLRSWEWQYLWMKSRSQAAFQLCTRPKPIGSLAFTGDGRRLVVNETHGETVVYDIATRRPIPGFVQTNAGWRMAYGAANDHVAFQVDGSTNLNWEVVVWDLRRNAIVSRMHYEQIYINSLAFSPDGRWLAGFCTAGACVWEVATGNLVTHIPSHSTRSEIIVGVVAFVPPGDALAVGDLNGLIRLHALPDGQVRSEFKLGDSPVGGLAVAPDGRWLAASMVSSNVVARAWPLPSGEPMDLPGLRVWPWALAFDPQSRFLAGGDGQNIRLWDLSGRRLLVSLTGHRLPVNALAFSPDGRFLASASAASGSDDSEVLFWEMDRFRRPAPPDFQTLKHGEPIAGIWAADWRSIAFAPDSKSFLALVKGCVTRHDALTLAPAEALPRYGSSNTSFAVSADGCWLATSDTAGIVHLWDQLTGKEQGSFRPYPEQRDVWGLRVLANGQLVTATYASGNVPLRIWRTATWQQVESVRAVNRRSHEWMQSAESSRDGRLLATGHLDGKVRLWEVASGLTLAEFRGHRWSVMEVAFSPDGRYLASAGWDGSMKLWDVPGRREAGSFTTQASPTWGVAFSPDGRRVARSGMGGRLSLIIWDVATRQKLTDLAAPGTGFFSPQFSPDGRTLTAMCGGETYFWRVPALADIDADQGADERR